jgi:hypothetical protein
MDEYIAFVASLIKIEHYVIICKVDYDQSCFFCGNYTNPVSRDGDVGLLCYSCLPSAPVCVSLAFLIA